MPTATSSVTIAKAAPSWPERAVLIKQSPSSSSILSTSTTTATLHTLYNRAARAFLLRDIPLTYSLIESAFAVLSPPTVIPDALADHRRKWDILRITLESRVYSSPSSPDELLPMPLQDDQIKSPQALLTAMYKRSLSLFSLTTGKSNPDSAHLPTQVLITLIYSSLRINCADVGRSIIEDWLAQREPPIPSTPSADSDRSGYEKVLELYCLQILPKLDEWEYAQEFLEYERELSTTSRESFKNILKSLWDEGMASNKTRNMFLSSSSVETSRSCSPAPSSSSTSSLSTTSTSTVVPSTVRNTSHSRSVTSPSASTSGSTASLSSNSTATPAPFQSSRPVLRSRPVDSSSPPFSNQIASLPRSNSQPGALLSSNLSTYAILKAFLAPYLTISNISTFFLLFIVIPSVSLVLRARRRRRQAPNSFPGADNNAALARKLLQRDTVGTGVLSKAWREVFRVLSDTVRMAGSGLV